MPGVRKQAAHGVLDERWDQRERTDKRFQFSGGKSVGEVGIGGWRDAGASPGGEQLGPGRGTE